MNISFYITNFDIRHFYVQTKLFSLESPDDLELGALSRLTEAMSRHFHKNNLIFYKIVKVAWSDEFLDIKFLLYGKIWVEQSWKWNILNFCKCFDLKKKFLAKLSGPALAYLKASSNIGYACSTFKSVLTRKFHCFTKFQLFQLKSLTLGTFLFNVHSIVFMVLSILQVHVWYFLFISAVWVKKNLFLYKM